MTEAAGLILVGAGLVLIFVLQLVLIAKINRKDARFDKLDSRVTKIEEIITTGQIDRGSVIAFRAELNARFASNLDPVHVHLADQDRKLDEIRALVLGKLETQAHQ